MGKGCFLCRFLFYSSCSTVRDTCSNRWLYFSKEEVLELRVISKIRLADIENKLNLETINDIDIIINHPGITELGFMVRRDGQLRSLRHYASCVENVTDAGRGSCKEWKGRTNVGRRSFTWKMYQMKLNWNQ